MNKNIRGYKDKEGGFYETYWQQATFRYPIRVRIFSPFHYAEIYARLYTGFKKYRYI